MPIEVAVGAVKFERRPTTYTNYVDRKSVDYSELSTG